MVGTLNIKCTLRNISQKWRHFWIIHNTTIVSIPHFYPAFVDQEHVLSMSSVRHMSFLCFLGRTFGEDKSSELLKRTCLVKVLCNVHLLGSVLSNLCKKRQFSLSFIREFQQTSHAPNCEFFMAGLKYIFCISLQKNHTTKDNSVYKNL